MTVVFEPADYHVYWTDPNRQKFEPIMEGSCKVCDDGKTDVRLLPFVKFRPTKRIFKPKDYLEVHLTCVGSDTVVTAGSYVRIPVTMKNLRTGDKYPTFLTGGLTAGANAVSDNGAGLVMVAGEKKMAWYYRILDGMEMVIGHEAPFNSRVLISAYDDTT